MQISRVCQVYFSPCGSVRQVVAKMAERAAEALQVPVFDCDFTLPPAREQRYGFGAGDLVFFGTPVYAGRVPNKIMPFVQGGFSGKGALAVPVVVFGNRSFDDGLVELRNLLEENGFHTIAAAAVVARHSFSKVIGAGRPNEADMEAIAAFSGHVLEKVKKISSADSWEPVSVPGTNPPEKYYTPLGMDGKPAKFLKAVPKTSGECSRCGLCAAVCPMGSIDREDPTHIMGICIKCQACIQKCPKQAKYFDDQAFLSHKQMLEESFTVNKEIEFYDS